MDDRRGPHARVPLRFATVGSVDDGKSTLIGRLLHDSKSIFEDQLEHVEAVSKQRGDDYVDLALLTDGLRAEREQGITIDVAYRYFSTPQRDFIIADCPGHVQYTRNAITGASTADLAIVLVDARNGVVEQTRRHSLLVSLLGVPHLVICVNKMDLVELRPRHVSTRSATSSPNSPARSTSTTSRSSRSRRCRATTSSTAPRRWAGTRARRCCTTSRRCTSRATPTSIDVRFPVQYVIRPSAPSTPTTAATPAGRRRRAARRRRGARAAVGMTSTIERIDTVDGPVEEARPPMAVTLMLTDDLDISRGDMICRPHNQPTPSQDLDAMVAWMDCDHPLALRSLHAEAHDPHGAGDGHRPALPARRAHDAPRRRVVAAGAQRDRAGHAALDGADLRRRLPPQPHHGQLHPHRRVDEPDGRRWHDPHVARPRDAIRRIVWHDTTVGRDDRWSAHRAGRRDRVVHRPVGVGQVDRRQRRRRPRCSTAGRAVYCSTATTSATGSTPTSGSPPPTGPRTSAASARWPGCWPTPGSSCSCR